MIETSHLTTWKEAPMKIMITGGAGFIGSHIADLLIHNGHAVVIVDDLSNGKKENINPQAVFYHISILDGGLAEIFRKERPEVVIHHAAQISVRDSVKDPLRDLEINIKGSVQLLEHCKNNQVRKVIFSSTGGALYGEQDYFPADENHPMRPLSPYAIAKLSVEKYLFFYFTTHRLPYTALRYANVYGPRQDPFGEAGVVAIFCQRMLKGDQPVINGNGNQTRDFVYVGDVARANLLAFQHEVTGEINIGTGVETSINTIFNEIRSFVAPDTPEVHGPAMPGEQLRSVLSYQKARTVLGWEPSMPLTAGLKHTVDFFRNRHKEIS
jgi:UDP-glucose 4-epimerase